MAKRFYWIKLREDFMSGEVADYLMSQRDGAKYLALYLMLCLKTTDTGGKLCRQVGDMVVPYDESKIQRDCKWFSLSTIRAALKLFKACGLFAEDANKMLYIVHFSDMVGSETDAALRMRSSRKMCNNVRGESEHCANIVTQEIRDKSSEKRDKEFRENDVVVNRNPNKEDHDHDDHDSLVSYASNNLQYLSPTNMEELISFRDALSDDMIRFGIDQACANGARRYSYVCKILNAYVERGFKSVGDIKEHEAKRAQGRENGSYDYSQDDDSDPFKGW